MPERSIYDAPISTPRRSGGGGWQDNSVVQTFEDIRSKDPVTGSFSKDKKKKPRPSLEQRIYGKGRAQLRAYNALLEPTLDLEGRAAAGYGDIYRLESDKAAVHDLNMFRDLGPQYVQALRAADPEQAALLSALNAGALRLNAPGYSNPYEDRELMQSVRAAQAARGMGFGQSDALGEILALDRSREGRTMARGQYGAGIAGLNQRTTGDLLYALTGRASQPQGSNPMSPGYNQVGQDALSLTINEDIMRQQRQMASDANRYALYGAGIQALGSIAGGVAGGVCWVAEELYGVDDMRTHLARAYVERQPHEGFFAEYRKHGKEWAKWLAANPHFKPLLKPVWDTFWREEQRARAMNKNYRETIPEAV